MNAVHANVTAFTNNQQKLQNTKNLWNMGKAVMAACKFFFKNGQWETIMPLQNHSPIGAPTKKWPENMEQFTWEHPRQSVTSRKVHSNFIEITLRHRSYTANVLQILPEHFPIRKSMDDCFWSENHIYEKIYNKNMMKYCAINLNTGYSSISRILHLNQFYCKQNLWDPFFKK